MSPMHSDHYVKALLDDRRRDALPRQHRRHSESWRHRWGAALVGIGDRLRTAGARLQGEPAVAPPVAASGC